jgi:LPXTG-motif cell wall-anchored protein
MKNMKKIFAILLSLSLVLSMSVPSLVFGADKAGPVSPGRTVTINNEDDGHLYEAYQIFKGDLVTVYEEYDLTDFTADNPDNPTKYTKGTGDAQVVLTVDGNDLKDKDGKKVAIKDGNTWYTAGKNNDGKKATKRTLTNAEFGANLDLQKVVSKETMVGGKDINGKNFLEAFNFVFGRSLEAKTDLRDYAEALLAEIGTITDGETLADLFNAYLKGDVYASADTKNSDNQYKLTGLAEGYYFIKDKDGSQSETNKAYTDFILQVVEDTEVAAKADRPDIEKKILEIYNPKDGTLMQAKGKKETGKFAEIDTDGTMENAVPLYHMVRSEGSNAGKLLYHKVIDGVPSLGTFVPENEATAADKLYPVIVTEKKNGDYDNKPIMRNEAGDLYTLRVDENSASIGEWVRYEIPADIPDMKGYSKYYYIITDTLAPGLTLPDDAFTGGATSGHPLKVEIEYADGYRVPLTAKDGTQSYGDPAEPFKVITGEKSYYYETATVNSNDEYNGGKKITLTLNDFIQYKTDDPTHGAAVKVYVTYDVQVNNKAIIGNPGNPNKVDLTYSRNPNITPDGEKNKPGDKDSDVTGKTPERVVRTYVTELILKKIDKDGNFLSGAKFLVTGTRQIPTKSVEEKYIEFKDQNGDGKDDTHPEITKATHYKLKDGKGWTDQKPTFDTVDNTDPQNPVTVRGNYTKYEDYDGQSSYTSQADVDAAIQPKYYHYIETTITYDTRELGRYLEADAQNPATHYALTDGTYTTAEPTTETAATYKTYSGADISTITKTHYFAPGMEIEVGDYGYLDLSGLGAGTYTIKETEAPEGYNLLREDIEVVIEFNTNNDAADYSAQTDYFTAKYRIGNKDYTSLNLSTEAITVDHKINGDANKNIGEKYFLIPIENRQGNELPETGGIGTKIFYTLGAILVLLAGILLITRRRMAHNNQ